MKIPMFKYQHLQTVCCPKLQLSLIKKYDTICTCTSETYMYINTLGKNTNKTQHTYFHNGVFTMLCFISVALKWIQKEISKLPQVNNKLKVRSLHLHHFSLSSLLCKRSALKCFCHVRICR